MAASITRPAASVARNTLQTIPWSGIVAPVHVASRSDWFGLFVPTAADAEPTLWQLTDGSASGSGALFLPPGLAALTYELRLFSGHTQAKLATSATFTVTAGTSPSVTTPGSVSANAAMTVTWSGIADPQPTDWVELDSAITFLPTAPPAQVGTGGAAAGSAGLYLPNTLAPGTYVVSLNRAAIPAYGLDVVRLASSASFTVTGTSIATLASPGNQPAGAQVLATWANIVSPAPSALDWVGIFALGAPASAPLGWRYLSGSASGSLPFVIPAFLGTASYELRLYSGTDQSLLATSASFTVTAVP